MGMQISKRPLTSKGIKALKPKTSPYRVPDYPRTGLNLSVIVSGSKKWVFAYTSPVTRKRLLWTFAAFPAVELAEARQRVADYRQQVTDGIDPRNKDKESKAEATKAEATRNASMGTVKDLFNMYVEDMKLDGKTSFDDVESKFKNHIKKHIGKLPANEVTIDIAGDMLADIAQDASLNVADKCRTFCQRAWRIGLSMRSNIRWKKSDIQYGLNSNPFMLIEPINLNKGVDDRYLTKDELVYVWNNMGVEAMHRQLALAVKLLLATGQRVQEVLYAEWSEFNFETGLWVMPWSKRKTRNKVKHDHVIPLTDFHIDLLNQIKALSGDSKYLFPNSVDTENDVCRDRNALTQAVSRFCKPNKKKDFERMTPFAAKACRKTFKTLGAEHVKMSKEVRDRLQGHSISDVSSKHYDRYDYLEEKRIGMQLWTDWLKRTVNGQSGNVLGACHAN